MTYKIFPTIILFVFLFGFTGAPLAQDSMPDMDWQWGTEPVHSQGSDNPADGKLWGIAARKDNIQITFRLEVKNDLSAGGWVGDIRGPEKFYAKFRLMDHKDHQVYFQIENARAAGPDAEYGIWKDGPPTASFQTVSFPFNWDMALKIKGHKSLILNYARADAPDVSRDIEFPLDNFTQKLSEMEAAIRAVPGADKYLLTDYEIKNMPINQLPENIAAPLIKELSEASKFLNKPESDLLSLSFEQIETLILEQRKANSDRARADTKAEHQKIYDQEPDWRDLNVCPKPDVKYCANIGRKGYEVDNMFKKEYDYGKIIGVVWRSEGSIIHIYGGVVDLGIDPEIVRAKTAKYYYVLENEKGHLELRSTEAIQLR